MNASASGPNFFIVGAPKAGTTSLYHYLSQHPEVYFSPIKEPHYFASDIKPETFRKQFKQDTMFDVDAYLKHDFPKAKHQAFIQNKEDYLSLYKGSEQCKAVGEASASYLYSESAAANIASFNPEAKIIAILRNPVERAFSHYFMDRKMNYVQTEFLDAIKEDQAKEAKGWGLSNLYIELGLYRSQLQRYFSNFKTEQIFICYHEELKADPKKLMSRITTFLELGPFESFETEKIHLKAQLPRFKLINKGVRALKVNKWLPKKMKSRLKGLIFTSKNLPTLNANDYVELMPFFEKEIKELSVLLENNLEHWIKKSST